MKMIVWCILDALVLVLSILSVFGTTKSGDPKVDTSLLIVDSIALIIVLIVLIKWIIILIRKKK